MELKKNNEVFLTLEEVAKILKITLKSVRVQLMLYMLRLYMNHLIERDISDLNKLN